MLYTALRSEITSMSTVTYFTLLISLLKTVSLLKTARKTWMVDMVNNVLTFTPAVQDFSALFGGLFFLMRKRKQLFR